MGRVIPFSEFENYYQKIQKSPGFVPGTILDTNVIVSLTYDIKSNHDEVVEFVDLLQNHDFRTFATVTTKAEFLDFQRRLIMTEMLRDSLFSSSKLKLSQRAISAVQTVSGRLAQRERRGGDPVFNDADLKEIKSAFSAGSNSGKIGWLKLCDEVLLKRLPEAETILSDCGIEYVSQHDPSQTALFKSTIGWSDAVIISAKTCLGFSDAMILNALQCSRFHFAVSTDFDLGYAALAGTEIKDVIMPDEVAKKYKALHFQ